MTTIKTRICDKCGKIITTDSSVYNHIDIMPHSALDILPYMIDLCESCVNLLSEWLHLP